MKYKSRIIINNGDRKGQSLVETALFFTIIVILLGGAVDLGRAFFSFIAIRDGAQEGATYGSLNPDDTSGIESRVRGSSTNPVNLADTTNVAIAVSWSDVTNKCSFTINAGEPHTITVTVTYQFRFVSPLLDSLSGTTISLPATITHAILYPPCA
ncbi:MAG: pilus assembly protein [Chloroflexota bacterium]